MNIYTDLLYTEKLKKMTFEEILDSFICNNIVFEFSHQKGRVSVQDKEEADE